MAIRDGLTKKLSSSGIITTAGKTGIVRAITLLSGTSTASITIRDGGASGTEKWKLSVEATQAVGDKSVPVSFPGTGLIGVTDLYGTLAGTGAVAYINYDEIEQ